MDCLEFGNLQQLIYADLTRNIGEAKDKDDLGVRHVIDIVKSTVEIHPDIARETDSVGRVNDRVFVPASKANCHIGFVQLAANLPTSDIDTVFPILVEILRDIPEIEFEKTLIWDSWALPDQLVYTTVSALLRLAILYPHYRLDATSSILQFSSRLIERLKNELPNEVLVQYAPSFHGFYRAIISSPFSWSIEEWTELTTNLQSLLLPEIVDHLNNLLPDSLSAEETDPEKTRFVRIFLARYVSRDRPLTGYFIVCCLMEIIWTVLAQTMSPPPQPEANSSETVGLEEEAAAANRVWGRLMRKAMPDQNVAESSRDMLDRVSGYAMRCYTDLLVQIESMDTEPSLDTYSWETMSESLKLASICSVALKEMNVDLLSRVKQLLSEESPIVDTLVQEAALKATSVLVQNYPTIASMMSGHLRRYVTSPLPMFEYEFASETRAPPPLAAAAKCLAMCIRLAPGDDFIMSNMYSLLNYISATSKETHDGSWSYASTINSEDQTTMQSLKSGLQAFNEDQQRLIGISTISVVTCLATEFKIDEVTRLTVSMLLQRLRSAEPTVEAAIVYNLVDLAIIAPENAFNDIIKAFSFINRSANPDDPRFSNNTTLAAQTRLAQELRRRPECRDVYLDELLRLFIDKGVAIQNAAISNHDLKIDDMVDQLGSLLLPIDALLSQNDFNSSLSASSETVTLFRNLWFLCVLFRFTESEHGDLSTDWQVAVLTRIAIKTPPIVLEEVPDFVTSTLEYNTIIRQEFAQHATSTHRAILSKLIAIRHSEIKYLLPTQVIFLLTLYELETMRSSVGYPSSLPMYFVNESVNGHVALSGCMDSLVDKIILVAINELSRQVVEHSLPDNISEEMRNLLVFSCHRVSKTRDVAIRYLNRLISSFPSLMCDTSLVYAILEVLTMLRRACEGEFTDEYDPVYDFHSELSKINLQLSDSYQSRNEMLSRLHMMSTSWFELALARAPIEFQATLQKYLTANQMQTSNNFAEFGASVALRFASAVGPSERKIAPVSGTNPWQPDRSKLLATQIARKERFEGEMKGLAFSGVKIDGEQGIPRHLPRAGGIDLKETLVNVFKDVQMKKSTMTVSGLKELLFRCAAALVYVSEPDYETLRYLVALPFQIFSISVMSASIEVWTWIIGERPDLEIPLLMEINASWTSTIEHKAGLFSEAMNSVDPFIRSVEYSPTDKSIIDRSAAGARKLLTPHCLVLQMLLSRFQGARYRKPGIMFLITRLVLCSARAYGSMSTHPLAREARFSFLLFGFEALKSSKMDSYCEQQLRDALYRMAFSWFTIRPQWSYGANRVQIRADVKILNDFLELLQQDARRGTYTISSGSSGPRADYGGTKDANRLLRLFVENEIYRLIVWDNPLNEPKRGLDYTATLERSMTEESWTSEVRTAWKIDPALVVRLAERFKHHSVVEREAGRWIRAHTRDVLDHAEALQFVVGQQIDRYHTRDLKHVLLWAPVTPVTAVSYFEPRYLNDPVLLQYAHRVLEQHPVGVTFFFVPQIVQSLRNDDLGYVKRFIFETAKISQLFCHQIIWNMKANCYKDDATEVEDPMKPHLDKMTDLVVNSLSGEARNFYDKEFGFFNEVTSISGKLKPFIKKSKPEKKAKIDEEMAKIKVEVGVYLPSNPDGIVVDIDRKSGRPLQSHAKAPFMASFKVRKERLVVTNDPDSVLADEITAEGREEQDIWQAAIFKVGDDCRQDVLALQVIAMFKNVFTNVGLNLYLYPYRVTATGPGCGVIDVVPNATSRDEMGRAKINDLLGFFIAKYGGEDSIAFQRARLNFIQSMAAYSVACYILQIKDRHNGNIMIDGEGHIVHIDFGFLFDIGPGGIKFEPNSFKLNHEMVVLMGGRYSQGYALFQQLTIKAFLAIRPHVDTIVSTVELMLGTDLPSFKGEATIKRLRDRIVPNLTERQAADWMMGVVKNAHENMRSVAYDEFQRLQNGIPYK